MPGHNKPRFERTALPADVMRLLDASDVTEIDLKFERLMQLDDTMNALRLHLEKLAAIAEAAERQRRY